MSVPFDKIARMYDLSVPSIPRSYIELIQHSFNLVGTDRVLDVGCGAGELALTLSEFSFHVQGIDSSKEMLEIAHKRDVQKSVNWVCSPVEDFSLGSDNYNLIISFEAFHLFPNPTELIQRFALALKQGGYLCIGWANFEWELILRHLITKIFASYKISWGDWNFWSCPNLPTLVKYGSSAFSPLVYKIVDISTNTHIVDIANYLVSTSRASSLNSEERKSLFHELKIGFKKELRSEWSSGIASYSLAYCIKGSG